MFLGLLSPSLIVFLLLVGGKLNYVSETVFVYLTAFVIMMLAIILAFMSFYIGREISRKAQQLFLTIALCGPILFLLAGLVFRQFDLYYFGILMSITASFGNVIFNKSGNSIGVPGSNTSPAHSPPQSPKSPKSSDYSNYPYYSHADFLSDITQNISMIPLTPRSKSSVNISSSPSSLYHSSSSSSSSFLPFRSFWKFGNKKNNENKKQNNLDYDGNVPLLSKEIKALSLRKAETSNNNNHKQKNTQVNKRLSPRSSQVNNETRRALFDKK